MSISRILKKVVISLAVACLVAWVVQWALAVGSVERQDYDGAGRTGLVHFAGAQYDFGIKALYENRMEDAQGFFRQAVLTNPLHVDAWLRLAEVKQAAGDAGAAMEILAFTDWLAGDVVKWKWRQLLMARQLGMEDMFVENVNFVIPFSRLRNQAVEIIDTYYERQTKKVLGVLEAENLPDYLIWLMRRERVEDSLVTWDLLTEKLSVDSGLYERYIGFLFRHKQIMESVRIRKNYTGLEDVMTNPGFEKPPAGSVFAWQAWSRDFWDVRRDNYQAVEGNYALRIDFSGKENVNFYHVRQYVPVKPGNSYSLSFWWRSKNLTTDKRPFFEVRGVNCESSSWKTEMIAPDSDWHEQKIEFTPAEDCQAVMIRLRRTRSQRFDRKIDGTLWVDGFELKMK